MKAIRRFLHCLWIATRNAAYIDVYGDQRNAASRQDDHWTPSTGLTVAETDGPDNPSAR